jgi:CPA1 family monovalent cation:H+ antiporter
MAGESLFNDGIGIVLFLALFGAAVDGQALSPGHLVHAFLLEGTGGLALGGVLGWAVSALLRGVDDYPVEIFLTLALAAGAYTLASTLGLSGPLAAVAAGLIVGSHGRDTGMSQRTQAQLDGFWTVVDQMLSAVLFMLVGLEMLLIAHDRWHILLGALAVPVVLFARWASVTTCLAAIRRWCRLDAGTVTVLTWGGLRGGISIALALSLPPGAPRETIVTSTYIVVAFSVLGQGLTLSRLARAVIGGR